MLINVLRIKNSMLQSHNKHIHTACHSQTCYNFYYSVIWIITVASKATTSAYFFPLLRVSSYFYSTKTDVDSYDASFPYLVSYTTSAHISPCSPEKHDTSFRCFFLKTIFDCCGYTLSLSLSTTTILNVPLIYQAKEFEMVFLFIEVLSWNTLHFGAQLQPPHAPVTVTYPASFTIRCSHGPWKKNRCDIRLYTDGHTDRETDRHLPPLCRDRGGCNHGFAPSKNMIPLPHSSPPASWTLLSPLSAKDSRNISSNDRYRHRLSSLDNNKTGIYLSIYLFIYNFICKSIKSIHRRKGAAREEMIPE